MKRRRRPWRRQLRRLGHGVRRIAMACLIFVAVLPPLAVLIFGIAPVSMTPLMAVRLAQGQGLVRVPRPLNDISPQLVRAVIAAEDTRFCQHDGFDWSAIEKASRNNADGGRLRGASTISMQTSKNLLLWPGRDWLRKGLEAYTTLFLERLWSKRRIMETYLNIIEWGPGIYGAEAAARYHFSKTAATLTDFEAARLAVILPDPRHWRANPPGPYVAQRAQVILARMDKVEAQGLTRCVRH